MGLLMMAVFRFPRIRFCVGFCFFVAAFAWVRFLCARLRAFFVDIASTNRRAAPGFGLVRVYGYLSSGSSSSICVGVG